MMGTLKPAPRFVPTLTEVVQLGYVANPPAIDREALVEQVLRELRPRIEQQLRIALYALVEDQLCKAMPQWELDVETAVNAAIAQALSQRMSSES